MAPPDHPHSECQSSSDDDERPPRTSGLNHGTVENGFYNLTADDLRGKKLGKAAFIAGQRRRRRFTPGRRKEVAEVRSVGACGDCRKRKVRCKHALHNPSSSIPISNKRSSHNESPDSSNPSSLSSNSSIATHFGAFQLDRLNHFVSPEHPIIRYRDSYEEDPPAGRIAEASWTSYSDPMNESRARLSPKLEELSNIIPYQFQEVKDQSYLPSDSCMQDIDDMSKSLPSLFRPTKDEQFQQYMPVEGRVDPVDVWAVRKHLPSGELKTWHFGTGKITTQPPRSATDGVNKNKKKANSTGRVTPSVQRQQLDQGQRVHPTPPPQVTPPHQVMQYGPPPPQTLTPSWTPSDQRQPGPSLMYQSQPQGNQFAQGVLYGSSSFPPTSQLMGYGPQHYGPSHGHMQQFFTPTPTPSHHDYPGSSSMLRSGSAHSTHSMQSVGNGMRQMNISPQFPPGQGPFHQRYGDTAQVSQSQLQQARLQQSQLQQVARQLNYGTNMNNMMTPAAYGSPSMPPTGYQPLPGNYGSTSTPNNHGLAAPAAYYPNMNQPLPYNTTTTPSNPTSNSGSMRNRNNPHLMIPPATAATFATSQPPSLTIGASSELTPDTPFDTASHHTGRREMFSPQNPQAAPDMGFFSNPGLPTDQLFMNGFDPNVNENLSPDLGYADGSDAASDTMKPSPATVIMDAATPPIADVDVGDMSDWLRPLVPDAGVGIENLPDWLSPPGGVPDLENISGWLRLSPGPTFSGYGATGGSGIKPLTSGVAVAGEDAEAEELDWRGYSPDMGESVDGDGDA